MNHKKRLLRRIEVAESKLVAINNLIVTTPDDMDVTDQILHIINGSTQSGKWLGTNRES